MTAAKLSTPASTWLAGISEEAAALDAASMLRQLVSQSFNLTATIVYSSQLL